MTKKRERKIQKAIELTNQLSNQLIEELRVSDFKHDKTPVEVLHNQLIDDMLDHLFRFSIYLKYLSKSDIIG